MKLPDADIRDVMIEETFAGKSEVAFGHVKFEMIIRQSSRGVRRN